MTNVTAVRTNDWKKDDGTVTKVTNVTLDDGREVPGYDLPTEPEVGKPLPDGWEIATSAKGKPYIKVPKPGRGGGGFGGGAAAFRNTKEGQWVEVVGRLVNNLIDKYPDDIAGREAAWVWALSKLSGAPSAAPSPAPAGGGARPHPAAATPSPPSPAVSNEGGGGKAQNRTRSMEGSVSVPELELTGEGGTSSGTVCVHLDTSPLKPDGSALPAGKLRCLACNTVIRG